MAGYKILIADDSADSLDVLIQVLTRSGYETFAAEDGYKAIEIVRDNPIDLAILDFNLPDTNGTEVLRQIHKIQLNVPVIIMSADNSQSVKLDAFEAGACKFLSKPINLRRLEYYVSKAIESGTNQNSRGAEIREQSILIRWSKWIIRRK